MLGKERVCVCVCVCVLCVNHTGRSEDKQLVVSCNGLRKEFAIELAETYFQNLILYFELEC